MTVVYSLEGGSDPLGPEHVSFKLSQPMTIDHSDYWAMPRPDSDARVIVPGARIKSHWSIDNPDLAFPQMSVSFKSEPHRLVDIEIGRQWVTVSEKAKGVIETIDPGVHQFFPLSVVDAQGVPWTAQSMFAMIVARLVEVPNPTGSKPQQGMPRSSAPPMLRRLATVEATPGLPSAMVEFPLWAFDLQITRPLWNSHMMQALQDAELLGVDLIHPPGVRKHGECVNQIWFSELN